MTVWVVGDPGASARGTPDPALLVWCETNDFALVTNNRRSMPGHLRNHLAMESHVSGIFLIDPDATFGETVDDLVLIYEVGDTEDYRDRITSLPAI